MKWIIFKFVAPFTLVKSILQLRAHWLVALINRFCGLYPSPLNPACKYMQIQEEWVEPNAWWASTWTGLTSLLRFFHCKGSHVPWEQSPERSRDPRAKPADLGSNPSPNSHCPTPSWASAFLSGLRVLTVPRGNTLGRVGLGPKEAGAPELRRCCSSRPARSWGAGHFCPSRISEASGENCLSLGLQHGRARAPWESGDFLNEWHPLPN